MPRQKNAGEMHNIKNSVTLETQRLILRPFMVSDAEEMYLNWGGDPDVTRYMFHEAAASIKETKERIRGWMLTFNSADLNIWNYLAVTLKDGAKQIGAIFYAHTNIEARSAEIGYEIGKRWWHSGYSTEALSALLEYLFEIKKLNRITGVHDTRNPYSGAVMKKCGMKYEGTMRRERFLKGEMIDRDHYAILAEERRGELRIEN